MHICRKRLKMKPYEEIVLSYINKYHEINLEQLQYGDEGADIFLDYLSDQSKSMSVLYRT